MYSRVRASQLGLTQELEPKSRKSTKKTPEITLRLIEVRSGRTWHSYLTSVLEPTVLPPYVVVDLYRRRWRIEEAFNTVKRLLGLSYLWTGSLNGIQLQSKGNLVVLCCAGRFR